MKKIVLLAGVATGLFAFNANAVEFNPYVGLDFAYSDFGTKSEAKSVVENKYKSFKVDLGAKLHKNFGLELFYQQSGDESKSAVDIFGDTLKTTTEYKAYGVDAIGYLPIVDNVEGLASIGFAKYDFKAKFGADYYGHGDEDNMALRLGLGAQYSINNHWALNGMIRYAKIDDGSDDVFEDLTEFSLGIRYNF